MYIVLTVLREVGWPHFLLGYAFHFHCRLKLHNFARHKVTWVLGSGYELRGVRVHLVPLIDRNPMS